MSKKKREKKINFVYSLLIRYFLLLITAIPSFWIFYFIFTPLTIYPVYIILSLFFNTYLFGNVIFLGNSFSPIEIIDACIAGSAYYLLLIFNLSIPNIQFVQRVKMVFFAFFSFLAVNILRIVILSVIFILKPSMFDITHKLSWYIVSIIFVVGIWFIEVKKFKIKEIPFYSDIQSILRYIK